MNCHNIGLVIGREYSVRVRKKSFILTTLITPLLMGLLIVVPALMTLWGGGDEQKVRVFDGTGKVMPYFQDRSGIVFSEAVEGETPEILKSVFDESGYYAIVEISDFDEKCETAVTAYSKEPLSLEVRGAIASAVNKACEQQKLESYNIEGLSDIMAAIKTDIRIEALTLKDDGGTKEDSVEIYMILAYIMSFLIYMFIFLFGTMVMRGVIEEKSNRVVEVIVSSVNSVDLMLGKIIGIALVALTQFAIWVVLSIGIVTAVTSLAGPEKISPEAIAATATTPEVAEMTQAVTEDASGIAGVLEKIQGVDWPLIIGSFVIYFLLGYLLYAAMFAAIGAACDNETDTGQLQLPVTLPLIIGLFIMLHAFSHPSSSLSFWASIIPWTSPLVMLARIPFGIVQPWELLLSIGLLVLTFLATVWASAKIYKAGILMYGKKTTFKDLWKWIKQKE